MAAKDTALANAILDALYRGESFDDWVADNFPDDYYLALFTVSPKASSDGEEADYEGYERLPLARDGSDFGASASGRTSNLNRLTFPNATDDAGQRLVAFAVVSSSAGAFVKSHYGPVNPAVVIVVGKGPDFEVGALEVTES